MKEQGSKSLHADDGDNRERTQPDREDSGRTNKEEAYKAFAKDKRTRISKSTSGEKVEYQPRRESAPYEKKEYVPREKRDGDYEKRSNGERSYERKPYGDDSPRPRYDNREGYKPRREGESSGYKPRYDNDRREYKPRDNNNSGYRPRNDGERREYTPRDNNGSDYKPRSYGERKPYDRDGSYNRSGSSSERKSYNPNFSPSNKPYNRDENRSYGERKPYDRNDSGERRQYGDRAPRADRPDGNRYSHDDRPSYNRDRQSSYGRTPGNRQDKPYGKQGYSKPAPRYDSENYPTYPVPVIEDEIRLNRYIAMSGICSRREADELIKSGVVTVNGDVITEMGAKVKQNDEIKINGEVIQNEKKVYIVMNKPKGYVTSVEDPHADKTVMDLIKNGLKERVYPVGRLDKNSLGVLLITNDGDLAKRLMHPSYEKKKVYQIALDKPLTRADMDELVSGITLEDGEIHADAVSYVGESKSDIGIEIHSGRNRIVRRMFEHFGYKVLKLDRVYFAGLTKQRLKRGEWRFLTPREVQMLRSGQYE